MTKDDSKKPPQEKNPQKNNEEKKSDDTLMQEIKELADREKDFKNTIEKLKEAEEKIEELDNNYKRALADLQNYRERVKRDQTELVQFSLGAFIGNRILPAADNFKRALNHIPEEEKQKGWCEGIIRSMESLFEELKKDEIEEIQALGQKLDPNFHEAVMQGPGEKDVVIEVFENGYTFRGKVIRPAKVKVGNGE